MNGGAVGRLVRITAGYSLSTLAGPIFTMLLTPVYTRVLAVADYDTVDTLTMLGMILFMLGAVGITPALTALFYAPQHKDEQPALLASALWVGIGWSSVLALLVALCAAPLTRLTLARNDVAGLVQLVAWGLPFGVVSAIQSGVLRLHFAVWRANVLALITLFASVASNIVFVLLFGWGAAGVIGATIVTNVAGGVAGLVLAPQSLRSRPRAGLMKAVLRAGILLLPAGLASWALLYADRLFLVRAVSLEAIGVYAIAVKLAALLSLVIEPFKNAWGPLSLAIRDQTEAAREYSRVLAYYCAAAFGVALALSLFANEILLVVTTPAYVSGARYVWLLVLAPIAGGLTAAVAVGLYLEQRLAPLAWATLAAAVVNTALNVLLIPRYGALGASVATALGALVAPLLVGVAAQRARPIAFRCWDVAATIIVFFALVGGGGLVGSRVELVSIAARAGLLLAYVPLLCLFGVLDAASLRAAWRMLRRPRTLLRNLRGAP